MMTVNNRKTPIKAAFFAAITVGAMAIIPACVKDSESAKSTKLTKVETENKATKVKVATYPQFEGGQEGLVKFMQENIQYPETEKESGESVKALVAFTVSKKGEVTNVYIKNEDIAQPFKDAAIAAIEKMPNWEPGVSEGGEIVPVEMVLPIAFKLN